VDNHPAREYLMSSSGNLALAPAPRAEPYGRSEQAGSPSGDGRKAPLAAPVDSMRDPGAATLEPPRIAIFDSAERCDALAQSVERLGYAPVDAGAAPWESLPALGREMTAAIISDSVDLPLALSAALSPACPVILITHDSSFAFRLATVRAGVDAVLSRPVSLNELRDWLEHFERQRAEQAISVLIVDDDPIVSEFHAAMLRAAGMTTQIVNRPIDALDHLNAQVPDLLLTDVQMPEVDGIELARIIRQSRRFISLPIVFLSGERDSSRQMEARKFGGDIFIPKADAREQLVSMVRMRAERAAVVRQMIERDALTGLYNHSRFKDRLADELERCRRHGGFLSLAMIDLDRFKRINDTHGHLIGDEVIRTMASLLSGGLRRIDITGRYGGEEFGVILPSTAPAVAAEVIDKLRRRFAELPFAAARPFSATFSAGIAGSGEHGELAQLITAADAALYAAKSAGRNQVVLADAVKPAG
jgi:diguanylate cyclase (GGDEF)-like protein